MYFNIEMLVTLLPLLYSKSIRSTLSSNLFLVFSLSSFLALLILLTTLIPCVIVLLFFISAYFL